MLWVLVFQFTVGNVWAYTVEYHNAGGELDDAPVVVPILAGLVAGGVIGWQATVTVVESVWLGVASGFGAFIITVLFVRVCVNIVAGYRAV